MATLSLTNVRKYYGVHEVIKGVSLDIKDREFVVFVGPSGCGKSTLLRMIAGLEEISEGELRIDGKRVNELPPAERELSMVFQSYALYPHMTVAQNMEYALKLAKVPKSERVAAVAEAARVLQLEPYLDRKPGRLSGGQRQRVAIGRSIVRHPKVFLFDEPLSNLDAALRGKMRLELTRLHEQLNATMIYVTHDQIEAMTMADKIVVLRAGRIEQVGSALELYHRPCNLFVAGFMGSPQMNLLPGTVEAMENGHVRVSATWGPDLELPVANVGLVRGMHVTVGVRPEHITIDQSGSVAGQVTAVERLGSMTLVHVEAESSQSLVVQTDGFNDVKVHDRVRLALALSHAHLFDPDEQAVKQLLPHPLAA